MMVLGCDKQIPLPGFAYVGIPQDPWTRRRSNGICVVAAATTYASRTPAAVTEREGYRIVGIARCDKNRSLDSASLSFDLDHLRATHTEAPCRCRVHQRSVIPSKTRDGLWQLLQPGIVGPSPVEH